MVMAVNPAVGEDSKQPTSPLSGKTSPVGVETPLSSHPPPLREVDYDTAPTTLYRSIETRNWDLCSTQCETSPHEASTWISRKERDGKLRWRLLPLHGAIIFKAPEKTVEMLLATYPLGAQSKDDQGMLPIHLAFRNGASEGIVNLLLVAYPQSIDVKDRKGRIPLTLAQASSSPNKESFIRALERGPSYYAVAAAATERAAVTAEQRAIFDSKLLKLQERHKMELEEMRQASEAMKEELTRKNKELEGEFISSKGLSSVLTDHISALEAQLESRSDAERLLVSKNKKHEAEIKELKDELTAKENELIEERQKNKNASEKISNLEMDNSAYEKLLDEGSSMLKSLEETAQTEKTTLERTHDAIRAELAAAHHRIAVLEAALKKKTAVEDSLTHQLSTLTSQLAESDAATAIANLEVKERERFYGVEKRKLKEQIFDLTRKLASVASALDTMAFEQQAIVETSAKHQDAMKATRDQQDALLLRAQDHRTLLESVEVDRQAMIELMKKQERDMEESRKERERIEKEMERQNDDLKKAEEVREKIIEAVLKQKSHMQATAKELGEILVDESLMTVEGEVAPPLEEVGEEEEVSRVEISTDGEVVVVSTTAAADDDKNEQEEGRDVTTSDNDEVVTTSNVEQQQQQQPENDGDNDDDDVVTTNTTFESATEHLNVPSTPAAPAADDIVAALDNAIDEVEALRGDSPPVPEEMEEQQQQQQQHTGLVVEDITTTTTRDDDTNPAEEDDEEPQESEAGAVTIASV